MDLEMVSCTMVLVLVPVVITGGIHVDGLLDTSDALSSWRDREKRLEILKDSHAGAFAVITACVYFMAFYGGYSQISDNWTGNLHYGTGILHVQMFFWSWGLKPSRRRMLPGQ